MKNVTKIGSVFGIIVLFALIIGLGMNKIYNDTVLEVGYYPVETVMKECGYSKENDNMYEKEIANKAIEVLFDFETQVCTKNQYQFDIADSFYKDENGYYVKKETLEQILNYVLDIESGKVIVKEQEVVPHEWTEKNKLVAHSGGAVREAVGVNHYTNSLEAIVQNYNLGHRVFEIDFCLTSDNQLAAIHDWVQFANKDGIPLSAEEWKSYKMDDGCGGYYTSLLIGDVLDEMLVNKDMYIVTDSKSYELTEEQIRVQFQLIYDEAMKREPELLNRIIPQIYNEDMYNIIESIYSFPSIIYTIYASPDTPERIEEFASMHDNIKVIVCPVDHWGFDQAMIEKMHSHDLLLYAHTIQTFDQMQAGINKGYDGFYSGLLIPNDIQVYKNITN